MHYMLIMVAPSGTMTASVTFNYMAAEEVYLPPGWSAFVVKAESLQVRSNDG